MKTPNNQFRTQDNFVQLLDEGVWIDIGTVTKDGDGFIADTWNESLKRQFLWHPKRKDAVAWVARQWQPIMVSDNTPILQTEKETEKGNMPPGMIPDDILYNS